LSVTSAISNDGESKSEESASSNAYGKWGSNWFVAANLGANLYHGTTMTLTKESENIFDHAAFALDLYFGKWHTPGFGWRAGYSGLKMKSFDKKTKKEDWESVAYMHYHFDAMFNLCNLIGGYKADRVWEITPYVGIGWAGRTESNYDSKNSMTSGTFTGSISANYGIINSWNVAKRWAINLELSGTFFRNGFSSKVGQSGHDMMWTATAGLTVDLFRVVDWDNDPDVEALQGIYAGMIDGLQGQLDDALAANREKQNQIKALEQANRALETDIATYKNVKPLNVS
jgi:outer membrane protein W